MIFYRLLLITIDYYRLLSILLIDNNRQIIYSVTSISIDFRNQSIIIGGLKPLISMISIDFQYRFLSINYVRRNNTNDFKISTNCEQVPLNIDHKTSQITYWQIYWICPEPENALSDDTLYHVQLTGVKLITRVNFHLVWLGLLSLICAEMCRNVERLQGSSSCKRENWLISSFTRSGSVHSNSCFLMEYNCWLFSKGIHENDVFTDMTRSSWG